MMGTHLQGVGAMGGTWIGCVCTQSICVHDSQSTQEPILWAIHDGHRFAGSPGVGLMGRMWIRCVCTQSTCVCDSWSTQEPVLWAIHDRHRLTRCGLDGQD